MCPCKISAVNIIITLKPNVFKSNLQLLGEIKIAFAAKIAFVIKYNNSQMNLENSK